LALTVSEVAGELREINLHENGRLSGFSADWRYPASKKPRERLFGTAKTGRVSRHRAPEKAVLLKGLALVDSVTE